MTNEDLQAQHDEIWRQIYERQRETRKQLASYASTENCPTAGQNCDAIFTTGCTNQSGNCSSDK